MFVSRLSTQQVNAVRGIVTWTIRAAALILIATGAYLSLKRLALGVGNNFDLQLIFQTWQSTGEEQSMYRGIAMMLVGGVLAALSRRLAAWVVAMPPTGCPQCGYAVAPPQGAASPGRCPECGLPLEP